MRWCAQKENLRVQSTAFNSLWSIMRESVWPSFQNAPHTDARFSTYFRISQKNRMYIYSVYILAALIVPTAILEDLSSLKFDFYHLFTSFTKTSTCSMYEWHGWKTTSQVMFNYYRWHSFKEHTHTHNTNRAVEVQMSVFHSIIQCSVPISSC